MRARTHSTTRMSYHYDATMTKSRMEMTNFGCAQLERMAMTDIETRYSQLAQRMKDDEARIANAKERIAQARMRCAATCSARGTPLPSRSAT